MSRLKDQRNTSVKSPIRWSVKFDEGFYTVPIKNFEEKGDDRFVTGL